MGQADAVPDKEKRNRMILIIVMAFSSVVFVISSLFIARINGWLGKKDEVELLTVIDDDIGVEIGSQTLTYIDDTHMIDARCAGELEKMLSDCRSAGFSPVVTAAFRSESEQRELFNTLVAGFMSEGRDSTTAKALAMRQADLPGFSEHQLGLAADIEDLDGDEGIFDWLGENAWRYGFIRRYPQDKTELTAHPYVAGHFRYVGTEAAKQIYELGICLEEYVAMFYSK